jgi:hypothetical protein
LKRQLEVIVAQPGNPQHPNRRLKPRLEVTAIRSFSLFFILFVSFFYFQLKLGVQITFLSKNTI